MPEPPEVERFRKYVEDTSLHQQIAYVNSQQKGMLVTTDKELNGTLEWQYFSSHFSPWQISFH